MPLHFGTRFDNETVHLDGQQFERCTFVGCTLIYSGGELPSFSENAFASCEFGLRDGALRTLGFFRVLYAGGGDEWVNHWFSIVIGREQLSEAPIKSIQ